MLKTTEPVVRPEDRFIAAFEVNEGHALNGNNPALHGVRQAAIARFAELGFPGPKDELWKYTNIGKALKHSYDLRLETDAEGLTETDLAPFRLPGPSCGTAVLINGHFSAGLSSLEELPDGVIVCGLHEASKAQANAFNRHFAQYADYENTPFTALNTAFAQHGLFVYVPRNTVVEAPLHVVNLSRAEADLFFQPRSLVVAEAGTQLRVVDLYGSLTDTPTFANAVAEYYIGAGAHVQGFKLQNEGPEASRIDTVHAYQGEGSTFSMHTTTLGGALVRNNLNMLPDAEHCETHMYGLFLADGTMHVDTHTLVDHARPNCFSNELYKGILNDRATGVFNGKVLVRPDAQKTNAYQSNKSIVLSETAHMYAKPELEIYADDVKCSHGATTGQVEPEALFYLRSRGLSERQARKLLLLAFARDVLEAVPLEPLREHLDALVAARLDA